MFLSRQYISRCTFAPMKHTFYRRLHTTQTTMSPIKVGTELPSAILYEENPDNMINITLLGAKKKMVLFGVPGAFSPGCSKIHLPGYVNRAEEMKAAGVDVIVCVSVNDPYVMAAWATQHNTKGKVRMLADPRGRFIRLLDLGIMHSPLGGYRSKRFSMIVQNNLVELLNVEPDGMGMTCSLAHQLAYSSEEAETEDDDEELTPLQK